MPAAERRVAGSKPEYEKMRPYQLKTECRKLNLEQTGTRDELVARLEAAFHTGGGGGGGDAAAQPAPAATAVVEVEEEAATVSVAQRRAAMMNSQSALAEPPTSPRGGGTGGEATDARGLGAAASLDPARIEKMRPYQLKAELRKRGFDAAGERDELVLRLKGACDGSLSPADATATAPAPRPSPVASSDNGRQT
eukprot:COSAG02_NODE_21470_length_787_cov_0.638081_1_plen_194_part_10